MRKSKVAYDQTVDQLVATPAFREASSFQVDCPVCRHKFGFVNAQQAEMHKRDMRSAMTSFVGRAIHKLMN